jgi:peroxiredoxin
LSLAINAAKGEPMKQFLLVAGFAVLSIAQNAPATPHTQLKVGDEAPDFTLPDNNNKPVKLSDFRGKKNVVLAFFPAAFTGG